MKLKKVSKNKEIKFKKFLSKQKIKFSNIKNFDSLQLISFTLAFYKSFKVKLNIIEIKNKDISFFIKKIR